MITEQQKIINKFKGISDKHHKLSLLFYELSQSLMLSSKNKTLKDFKQEIKKLNLDIEKIRNISVDISNISLNDIKKNDNEDKQK